MNICNSSNIQQKMFLTSSVVLCLQAFAKKNSRFRRILNLYVPFALLLCKFKQFSILLIHTKCWIFPHLLLKLKHKLQKCNIIFLNNELEFNQKLTCSNNIKLNLILNNIGIFFIKHSNNILFWTIWICLQLKLLVNYIVSDVIQMIMVLYHFIKISCS